MAIQSAVVLAAGEGTRLRPLTRYRPKPMLPAGVRPILSYVLDAVVNVGIEDIHLVVGYQRDRVQSHFGPSYRDIPLTYHVQDTQLGSAHALEQARGPVAGDILVVNGDEVTANAVPRAVIEAHDDDLATVGVGESDAASQFGAVRLRDQRVAEFVERPGDGDYRLLNTGVYAFDQSIFEWIDDTDPSDGEVGIPQVIREALAAGEVVRGVRTEGLRTKATYPWDLLDLAGDILAEGLLNEPAAEPRIFVAGSADVHPDAVIRGGVAIAADAVIGPGAVVGPDVAVGTNATVAANATVERSVLDEDTRIGSGATILDTITGPGARVGPGAAVPDGPADVRIGTTVHENASLGCVLADRANLAGGASVSPGVLIGPEAAISPGGHVSTNIPGGTEVTR